MKIISWNINGLRSSEESFLQFFQREQPEIMMLQEVRSHPDQLSYFLKYIPGYEVLFNPSERSGYSGTAVYYKQDLSLDEVTLSAGNALLDSEGRTIICKKGNLIVINFYTPNGTSSQERLQFKLEFYRAIYTFAKKLLSSNYQVIIGGDLNVAPTEKDLYAPAQNKDHSGFLPQERDWFDSLVQLGFVDTFRLFEKGTGHYTWWHMRDPKRESNRGWRFDYFLVSQYLKPQVKGAKILRDVFGSDHCPIELEI